MYYPVGHPSWIMGGQSWFRSSFQILHYWRAPKGVINPTTTLPYPDNYTKLFIQKSKPFGVGKLSDTTATKGMDGLYFDPEKYVMYEKIDGKNYYRNEYYNKVLSKVKTTSGKQNPTVQFEKIELPEDAPFG